SVPVSLPLDQEPPRLRTRFTARRPSTVRGVSPTALMTFAPPDTVAFGDLHSPTCSGQHPLLRLTVEASNVRNLPVDPPIAPCPNSFLRGVTVERCRHRRPPPRATSPQCRRAGLRSTFPATSSRRECESGRGRPVRHR